MKKRLIYSWKNYTKFDEGVLAMGLFSRAVDRMVSEKVPHKRRRRMIVFVAILTLLSMVTSTVAWFSVNTFAGVDKIDVHISVAAQLRVSMEDHGSDINAVCR